MADTPDTPTSTADKPAPARRRAPRKTPGAPRKAATKSRLDKAEDTVKRTVTKAEGAAKAAVTKTEGAAKAAATKAEGAVASAAKAVKPRSTKRATPQPANRKGTDKKSNADKKDAKGSRWGVAAIAGGVAAAGAAAAALLSLRGSAAKTSPAPVKGAHTADGEDTSKSFDAGIADENAVPN